MDSYSNKINRIKNTIDEIRDDIEKMKQVKIYLFFLQKNEKTINSMMTSINPNIQNSNQKEIQNYTNPNFNNNNNNNDNLNMPNIENYLNYNNENVNNEIEDNNNNNNYLNNNNEYFN